MSRLSDAIRQAIEYADTDTLLREIDGICERRDWDALLDLRTHCRSAVDRGKQVWSIDEHARYRLALEGPHGLAASAVLEGPARFTLGPLTEVLAQRRQWPDIDPHLPPGPERTMVAHECAIRGQRIDPDSIDHALLEIPVILEPWEPRYALATYKSDRAEFPSPKLPPFEWLDLAAHPRANDDEVETALLDLVTPWTTMSNGVAEVASVDGDVHAALGALGLRRAGLARVSATSAFEWMGWAAASGGAYGRRRGAASGRFHTWWAAAGIGGLDPPPVPEQLAEVNGLLEWYLWTDGVSPGWNLRLAVADPDHGMAWAMTAADERNDPVET
jgi:hypothetical protein